MRFFTDAQIAAVADLHGVPMVVAYSLAADVALEQAIRADRQQRRDRRLAEMAAHLEREENDQ